MIVPSTFFMRVVCSAKLELVSATDVAGQEMDLCSFSMSQVNLSLFKPDNHMP